MIHKGERPFQCNICQKKFREKSNYNFHIKKHFKKLNKKLNKDNGDKIKQNFGKDELIMENIINNFGINKNIKLQKSSDIKNISNNTIINNEPEINNFKQENNNNDDIMNKIKESFYKYSNFNNQNYNCNNQFLNQFSKDDLNIQDNHSIKEDKNMLNIKNQILSSNHNEVNSISKNSNKLNEESITPDIKEENYKFENNYVNPTLIENVYINNGLYQNDLIIPCNIAIDNRVYNNFNNYYQLNFPFPFNFENLFFKENLN